MIKFLLRQIDRFGLPVFSKRELLAVSPEGFDHFFKSKILSYRQPSTDMERVGKPRCPHGCTLSVVEMEGGFEGVCLDHPHEDPVQIDKEDLKRYAFSIENFLECIRVANSIGGKVKGMSHGYYSLGAKEIGGVLVGFYYAPEVTSVEWQLFLTLKKGEAEAVWIVLSPSTKVMNPKERRKLLDEGVISVSLLESMNLATFELPVDKMMSALPKEYARDPKPTAKQEADYAERRYLCYDRVHIPGIVPKGRSNLIILNGIETRIMDSDFVLFMEFVAELKKGKDGWLVKRVDPGKHQLFSRLRSAVQGNLLKKNGKDFIESNPPKQYRVSTHPDFVTYDRKKLLKHPNATVKAHARKLP